MKLRPLAAALACAHALILASLDAHASHADEGLEEIIVTAVHMRKPLQVTTDPALPRQPHPSSLRSCKSRTWSRSSTATSP